MEQDKKGVKEKKTLQKFISKIKKHYTNISVIEIMKISIFCFMFIFCNLPLFSDEDLIFRVGVCHFENSTKNSESPADGILAIFYETVSLIQEHAMSTEEKIRYIKNEKQKEIDLEKKNLEEIYNKRDLIIFAEDKKDWSAKFKYYDEKIKEKKKDINLLEEKLDEIDINKSLNFPDKIPLEFKQADNSMYFKKIKGNNESTAENYSLDAFLYGFIEEINEYTYLEVRLWNNFLKKDVFVWKTALKRDDINRQIVPGTKLVKSALIGGPWAELSVKGPSDSMIFVNDKFAGLEAVNNLLLEPGEIDIEVRKIGFNNFNKKINLKNEESMAVSATMTAFETKEYIIQAFPAGSDVYLDSKWVGVSPLKITTNSEVSSVQIMHEGFNERLFFIDEDSNYYIKTELNKKANKRDAFLEDKRMGFLNTFGFTLLSIPVTAIAYSFYSEATYAYEKEYSLNGTAHIDELYRLRGIHNRQYSLFICSLGLNAFLILDTVFKAIDYVEAVEYFSN